MDYRYLSSDELNKMALEHFIYQPVGRDMISYLATAAANVIACDPTLMPQPQPQSQQKNLPPTPPRSPEARCVTSEDDTLPSLEQFITQLVVSSNVQVPTLMSTLVYLTRLKSKLQPMARGLRCTTHRIFLACLILAAKYLNDSSPKNKHWANYSHINTEKFAFGFSRSEVNLMEKQLLFLLEWDLRISEQDLFRELDFFLEPLRVKIAERHARKIRHREEKRRQQELYARYPSPPASRGQSRSRQASLAEQHHIRSTSAGSTTPPGLTYSSAGSSYTPSISSVRSSSITPSAELASSAADMYSQESSFYDSPVQVVVEDDANIPKVYHRPSRAMLAYEISANQYHELHGAQDGGIKKRARRGMWGRFLGGTVAVR